MELYGEGNVLLVMPVAVAVGSEHAEMCNAVQTDDIRKG